MFRYYYEDDNQNKLVAVSLKDFKKFASRMKKLGCDIKAFRTHQVTRTTWDYKQFWNGMSFGNW